MIKQFLKLLWNNDKRLIIFHFSWLLGLCLSVICMTIPLQQHEMEIYVTQKYKTNTDSSDPSHYISFSYDGDIYTDIVIDQDKWELLQPKVKNSISLAYYEYAIWAQLLLMFAMFGCALAFIFTGASAPILFRAIILYKAKIVEHRQKLNDSF